MKIVQAPIIAWYGFTASHFPRLPARKFITRDSFSTIQVFLKICNPETVNNIQDKLPKARLPHDYCSCSTYTKKHDYIRLRIYRVVPYENVFNDEKNGKK